MTESIRILVVDDHPIVRDGLVAILSAQPDLVVLGEAENGQEAIEKISSLNPDVVLLDLEMPVLDGIETLQKLQEAGAETRVIVFTVFDTDDRILTAIQAGARGYLLKGAPREEVYKAIRIVYQGGSLLQPVVASKLLDHVSRKATGTVDLDALTPRESEVLQELAKGLLNKEIADRLSISERTVKFHVSSILAKLNAGNRTEAAAIAARKGLIKN